MWEGKRETWGLRQRTMKSCEVDRRALFSMLHVRKEDGWETRYCGFPDLNISMWSNPLTAVCLYKVFFFFWFLFLDHTQTIENTAFNYKPIKFSQAVFPTCLSVYFHLWWSNSGKFMLHYNNQCISKDLFVKVICSHATTLKLKCSKTGLRWLLVRPETFTLHFSDSLFNIICMFCSLNDPPPHEDFCCCCCSL